MGILRVVGAKLAKCTLATNAHRRVLGCKLHIQNDVTIFKSFVTLLPCLRGIFVS